MFLQKDKSMEEINQNPYSLYRNYSEDLVDYKESFEQEFGFYPPLLTETTYSNLEPYEKKLVFAFWNQKEVVVVSSLSELFYDICNEIDSRIQ